MSLEFHVLFLLGADDAISGDRLQDGSSWIKVYWRKTEDNSTLIKRELKRSRSGSIDGEIFKWFVSKRLVTCSVKSNHFLDYEYIKIPRIISLLHALCDDETRCFHMKT